MCLAVVHPGTGPFDARRDLLAFLACLSCRFLCFVLLCFIEREAKRDTLEPRRLLFATYTLAKDQLETTLLDSILMFIRTHIGNT